MKSSLVYIILLLSLPCGSLWAQKNDDDSPEDNTGIINYTDEAPYFKEGSFSDYVANNYTFTKEIIKKGKPGTLWISFIVEKNGELSNVKVFGDNGLSPAQDTEAIRVVQSSSGKWVAAKVNGRLVRTNMKQKLIFEPDQFK